MITREQDAKERRNAWIILTVCPISIIIVAAFVFMGITPGLDAGHDSTYLLSICLLAGVLSVALPILRLLRIVSVSRVLSLAIYADIYMFLLSLHLGMYKTVNNWGEITHVISSMLVTFIVFALFHLMEKLSRSYVSFGSGVWVCVFAFVVTLGLGGVWEMVEGFTDAITGQDYMVYGVDDTLGDLIADVIGATIVCVAIGLYLKGGRKLGDLFSTMRIGRESFEIEP